MLTHRKLKVYTVQEVVRRWSGHAWEDDPSIIIAFPFPGGVLFGAEGPSAHQRVSFFLGPEDALIVGQKLIAAAKEAGIK